MNETGGRREKLRDWGKHAGRNGRIGAIGRHRLSAQQVTVTSLDTRHGAHTRHLTFCNCFRVVGAHWISEFADPMRCQPVWVLHGSMRSTSGYGFSARLEHCKMVVAIGLLIAVVCQGEPTDGVFLVGAHANSVIGGHHCVMVSFCLKSGCR